MRLVAGVGGCVEVAVLTACLSQAKTAEAEAPDGQPSATPTHTTTCQVGPVAPADPCGPPAPTTVGCSLERRVTHARTTEKGRQGPTMDGPMASESDGDHGPHPDVASPPCRRHSALPGRWSLLASSSGVLVALVAMLVVLAALPAPIHALCNTTQRARQDTVNVAILFW